MRAACASRRCALAHSCSPPRACSTDAAQPHIGCGRPSSPRRFPLIDVDPSVLYIDEGNVLTSAGTAAAIDLCLYMVRQDHGAEVANVFARRMIVPPHREGGQAQFVEAPISACDCDELAATLDWAVHHLDQDLTVAQLAEHARMSPRTFAAAVLRGHRHDAVAVVAPATRARGAAHAREHRPLRRSRRRSMWVRRGVDVANALPSCHGHDTAGLPRLLPRRLTRRTGIVSSSRVMTTPSYQSRRRQVRAVAGCARR